MARAPTLHTSIIITVIQPANSGNNILIRRRRQSSAEKIARRNRGEKLGVFHRMVFHSVAGALSLARSHYPPPGPPASQPTDLCRSFSFAAHSGCLSLCVTPKGAASVVVVSVFLGFFAKHTYVRLCGCHFLPALIIWREGVMVAMANQTHQQPEKGGAGNVLIPPQSTNQTLLAASFRIRPHYLTTPQIGRLGLVWLFLPGDVQLYYNVVVPRLVGWSGKFRTRLASQSHRAVEWRRDAGNRWSNIPQEVPNTQNDVVVRCVVHRVCGCVSGLLKVFPLFLGLWRHGSYAVAVPTSNIGTVNDGNQ